MICIFHETSVTVNTSTRRSIMLMPIYWAEQGRGNRKACIRLTREELGELKNAARTHFTTLGMTHLEKNRVST